MTPTTKNTETIKTLNTAEYFYYHEDDTKKISRITRNNKQFFAHHKKKDAQWQKGFGKDANRPLYNLKGLQDRPTDPVIVVEGEKTAEAVKSLLPDYVVITSSFGAKGAKKTDWSPLKDRDLLIIPDLDDAGMQYAKDVQKLTNSKSGIIDIRQFFERYAIQNGLVTETQRQLPSGYDLADSLNEGWTKELLNSMNFLDFVTTTMSKVATHETPEGYKVEDGQVLHFNEKKECYFKIGTEVKVLSRAIFVSDKEDDREGVIISFKNRQNVTIEKTITYSDLVDTKKFFSNLVDWGWKQDNLINEKLPRLISDFISKTEPLDQTKHYISSKIGWQKNKGEHLIFILDKGKNDVFNSSQNNQSAYRLKTQRETQFEVSKHTLQDWQDKVVRYTAGNPYLVFALCVAFVPPLLKFTDIDGACFNLHGESSKGKTTALKLASSVWGSQISTFNTTANGLEGFLRDHNDALAILDELSVTDASQVKKIPYLIGNGTGKRRMSKEAETRDPISFRTVVLSTGEMNLKGKLSEVKETATAGSTVRFIDIGVNKCKHGILDTLHGFADSKSLIEHINKYTNPNSQDAIKGVAIREYLKFLVSNKEVLTGLNNMIRSQENKLIEMLGYENKNINTQTLRVIKSFSLVAIAGLLVKDAGVLKFNDINFSDDDIIVNSIAQVLKWYLQDRGDIGATSEQVEVYEALQGVIEEEQNKFIDLNSKDSRTFGEVYGYKETKGEEEYFYFNPKTFNTKIKGRHYVVKYLISKGVIVEAKELLDSYTNTHQYRKAERLNGVVRQIVKIRAGAFHRES